MTNRILFLALAQGIKTTNSENVINNTACENLIGPFIIHYDSLMNLMTYNDSY